MFRPLFRLAANEPHLLADHVEAYSGLVVGELRAATTLWKRQLGLRLVAGACFALAALFAGNALMLGAVVPAATISAPWLLIAVPAVPALVGLLAAVAAASSPPAETFAMLRRQFAADAAMLREAGRV